MHTNIFVADKVTYQEFEIDHFTNVWIQLLIQLRSKRPIINEVGGNFTPLKKNIQTNRNNLHKGGGESNFDRVLEPCFSDFKDRKVSPIRYAKAISGPLLWEETS